MMMLCAMSADASTVTPPQEKIMALATGKVSVDDADER
jgi:hypothetical protein